MTEAEKPKEEVEASEFDGNAPVFELPEWWDNEDIELISDEE